MLYVIKWTMYNMICQLWCHSNLDIKSLCTHTLRINVYLSVHACTRAECICGLVRLFPFFSLFFI